MLENILAYSIIEVSNETNINVSFIFKFTVLEYTILDCHSDIKFDKSLCSVPYYSHK